METGIRILLLTALLAALPGCASVRDWFHQRAERTSFETLGGNIQLLTESERRFTYYDLSLGYNFLPGEAFIGRGIAMTNAFYLLGGIGGTDFAGDTKFTVNFGAGYRIVPAD